MCGWRAVFSPFPLSQIYVVDSNDKKRLGESADELMNLVGEEQLKGVPVLIYANKQDLDGALSAEEISHSFQLEQIKDRKWHIEGCSAIAGEGLREGLEWAAGAA